MQPMALGVLLLVVATPYPVIRYYEWRALRPHGPAAAGAIRGALRPYMQRLWWAWLVAVVISTGVTAVLGISSDTYLTLFGVAFGSFHLVWWPFAVPVINRLNTELEMRGLQRSGRRLPAARTASLTPRRVSSYLPPWALAAPWLLAILATAYLLWGAASTPPPDPRDWAWFVIFMVIPWCVLVLDSWWMRSEVAQSYPLHGSEWTADARMRDVESMRRFRVRGIYALMLIMLVAMFYNARLSLDLVQEPDSINAGYDFAGAAIVLGVFAGLFGAAFGIEASFRYHRAMRTNPEAIAQASRDGADTSQ